MSTDKISKTKDSISEQVFNSHFSQNEMEENELELLTQLSLKDEIISAMEDYGRLYRQTEMEEGRFSLPTEASLAFRLSQFKMEDMTHPRLAYEILEWLKSKSIQPKEEGFSLEDIKQAIYYGRNLDFKEHKTFEQAKETIDIWTISFLESISKSKPKEEDKDIEAIFNMSEEEIDKKLVEFGYDPRQVERNSDALIAKLKAMRLFPKTKDDGREAEWISVKDGMPEEGQIVDVWQMPDTQTQNNIEGLEKTHHGSQYTGWRSTNYKYSLKLEAEGLKYHSFEQVLEGYAHVRTSYDYKQLIVENGEVTHWRPLPAIPKQNPKP